MRNSFQLLIPESLDKDPKLDSNIFIGLCCVVAYLSEKKGYIVSFVTVVFCILIDITCRIFILHMDMGHSR